MIELKEDDVKIQNQQYKYPQIVPDLSQAKIKIQLDTAAFPPVRWFDVSTSKDQQRVNSIQRNSQFKNDVGILKGFIEAARFSLLQVLNSQETDRFVTHYQSYVNCKFYLLIVLAFAKWRSNNRIIDFQHIFNNQLQTKGITNPRSQKEADELNKAVIATMDYLQGSLQKAISKLYQGQSQQGYIRESNFIKLVDQQIRYNMMPQPNWDNKQQYKDNDKALLTGNQNEFQIRKRMSKAAGEIYPEVVQKQEGRDSNKVDKEKSHRQNSKNQQPFLIYSRDDLSGKLLFPYDRSLKLKRKFRDLIHL